MTVECEREGVPEASLMGFSQHRLASPISTLRIRDCDLARILDERVSGRTLLLADPYNFPAVSGYGRVECVDGADVELCHRLKAAQCGQVIAIGGCSVLDVGRWVAHCVGAELIAIPSILSTSCLSVNRSILYFRDTPVRRITTAPVETIVSLPLLTGAPPEMVAKWTHSGLGDLLANLSAAIDFAVRGPEYEDPSRETLEKLVPDIFGALQWCLNDFRGYDEDALVRVAQYLHASSVDVVIKNSTQLSAAGEHDLYYALIKHQKYSRKCPTHGELVSIGTLVATRYYAEQYGEAELYEQLREAYVRIGLPVSGAELEAIGVTREHILDGLRSIEGSGSFLLDAVAADDGRVLADCFGYA